MKKTLVVPLVFVAAACASKRPDAQVAVPPPAAGQVRAVASAAPPLGEVDAIKIAVTNGFDRPMRLDAGQVYALAGETRVAPLTSADAARRAGGRKMPGRLESGAKGAVTGTVLGSIGGAISGAIQGGVGLATAAGAAVGATLGAIGGVVAGGGSPDVVGFEDRALHDTTLAPTYSASGYVYFPKGRYSELEVLLASENGADVERLLVPIEPARDE
jgi:hypothetical protein